MIRFSFIIFGILLLIGCENDIPDFKRTNFKINGQEFEILSTYEIFNNYLKEYKNYKDFSHASKKLIFNPIEREILKDAEASFMINSIKIPYEPSDFLREQINHFNTKEAVEIIEKALYSITRLIPGPDTKIILLPVSPFLQEQLCKYNLPGYGVAIGSGKIIIAINQTADNWKEFLSYAIAHEYHHSTWISRNWISSDFTLLEYLIFEGKADAFAKSVNDSIEVPSTKYITREQEDFVWNMIKTDIDKKGTKRILNVMYGNDDIPFGSGYAIGYGILNSFKDNNPKNTDLEILDMKPRKILELSGYNN